MTVRMQCRDAMSGRNVGTQCRDAMSGRNVGTQCQDAMSGRNVRSQCPVAMSGHNVRGKKSFSKDGKVIMDLDDATMVMDNIKNTPKFWQKARYKLNAKLENLGPCDFFFTP